MPVSMEYPVVVEVGSAETKVGINGNSLFWESGDQLQFRVTSVSGETATAVLTLNDVDSGLGTAKFKGTVTMSEQPAKCEFAYNSSSFTEDGNIIFDYSQQDGTHKPYLYGVADYAPEGMICELSHVGGLFKIKVPDGVTSISLSSNSGEYTPTSDGTQTVYKGQSIAKVTSSSSAEKFIPVEGASHLISAEVPDGAETVYVFAPAVEYLEGLSIVCSHSDGSKMFKSFSEKGKLDSSFTFFAGSVLDLDLGEYSRFTSDCSCDWAHKYEGDENILTGTNVFLTGLTYSGSPSKIIDYWSVVVYDFVDNIVREVSITSIDNLFDDNKRVEFGDPKSEWPLLIPGDYSVSVICHVNGLDIECEANQNIKVTAPSYTVGVNGKTSWDYRSNPSTANSMDNDAIVEIVATVSVAPTILANENYDCKVAFSTTNKTSSQYSMNTTPFSSDVIFDGMSWGSHNLEASVTFCGVSQNTASPTPCYITGLPYKADWTQYNYDEWEYDDNVSDDGKAIKFEGPAARQYKRRIISPEFKIPEKESVNVATSISAASRNVDFIGMDYKRCRYFYYKSGTRDTKVDCSGDYIEATYYASLNLSEALASPYIAGANTMELSKLNPCMVYSTESYTHDKYLMGITITYAEE